MDKAMTGADFASPLAATVDDKAVERRKKNKSALDAPKGPTTWLVAPELVCVAGVDYAADPADPFYDDRVALPLDLGMVTDIDLHGVKVPVTVVKDGEVAKVTDGRRRVLHARAANVRRVERGEPPLRIKVFMDEGDAKQVFLTARRSNAFRVDDGVLQRARNAQRALERFGATMDEVAQAENVNTKAVAEWLRVLELCVDAHQAIEAGHVGVRAALLLLSDIPRNDQAKVLAEELAKHGGKIVQRTAKAGAANAKAKARGTSTDEEPAAEAAPTKSMVRKLLLAKEAGTMKPLFDEDDARMDGFVLGLRWMLGDVTTRGIKGLRPALRDLGLLG